MINKGQLRQKTGKRIRSDLVEIGSSHFFKKKDGFRVQWKGPATSALRLFLFLSHFFFLLNCPPMLIFSLTPDSRKGVGSYLQLNYKNSETAHEQQCSFFNVLS